MILKFLVIFTQYTPSVCPKSEYSHIGALFVLQRKNAILKCNSDFLHRHAYRPLAL